MTQPSDTSLALVALGAIEQSALALPLLVAGDPTGLIAAGVTRATGIKPAQWLRRASARYLDATPWPPAGPFATAIVRLPKSGDEADMNLHAVASVVQPGGTIWLYGANAEGIKSAPRRLACVAQGVETAAARGHGRVLVGARAADIIGLKAQLADWRSTITIELNGTSTTFDTYPGLFAEGRLDPATRMLIATLPALTSHQRVLDFGCGVGFLARALLMRAPGLSCYAVDNDAIAVLATRANVPEARVCLAHSLTGLTGLTGLGAAGFDLIVSNPPLHDGIREDHATLDALIKAAPAALRPGGILQIVTQRRVGVRARFEAAFTNSEILAEDGVFEVIRAVKRHAPPASRRGRRGGGRKTA